MMSRVLFLMIFLIQGVLMSAQIESVLVNGVKIPVIYEKDSKLPLRNMRIVFKKSGSIEDGKLEGLSSLVAALLNEGTKELGNIKFATELENRAISLGVYSGTETISIEVGSLSENFDYAIDMLSKLFASPNYSENTLKKIKTIALGNISQKENDFDFIASVNLKKMMFQNTPLASNKIGTIESINKITLKDIEDFISKHIVLSRAIVVIGGDLSKNEANEYVKKALSPLKEGKDEKLGFYEVSTKQKLKEVKKDTKQAYIYFGAPFNLKYNDKDAYKARVAAFILGAGGFGSRLMEEIRVKKGLAYSAYCRVSFSKSNTKFTGYLQTKLESQKEAIDTVKEEIKKFVKDGVSKEELKSAKEFLLGSEPLRVEILSQRLSRALDEYYKGFKIGHSQNELKKIEKLTLKELNSFIKEHSEINDLVFSIVNR